MVTEQLITLVTEPAEGEIVKSHPLFSFINIGQSGRNIHINIHMLYIYLIYILESQVVEYMYCNVFQFLI